MIWTLILAIPLATTIWNIIWLKIRKLPKQKSDYVVVIPARNEATNLPNLILDLAAQTLNPKKVVIVDDESTDGTGELVLKLSLAYEWLELAKGQPLPEGWKGKPWACMQGWEAAKKDDFEKLVFLDADIRLQPTALEKLTQYDRALCSFFPQQRYQGTDILLTPLVNWILLTFLPFQLAEKLSEPLLAAANGQCMVFQREAYRQLGGHAAVKTSLIEDVDFAIEMKKQGFKTAIFVGDLISCQMYPDLKSAVQGFSKNYFPAAKITPVAFVFLFTAITLIFLQPQAFWLILLQRLLVSTITRQNPLEIIFHPIQMLLFFVVGIYSLILIKIGQVSWKGRKYSSK